MTHCKRRRSRDRILAERLLDVVGQLGIGATAYNRLLTLRKLPDRIVFLPGEDIGSRHAANVAMVRLVHGLALQAQQICEQLSPELKAVQSIQRDDLSQATQPLRFAA